MSKKKMFDMQFQWFKADEYKPKKSGLYFIKHFNDIEIAYFNKTTEEFCIFDFDSRIMLATVLCNVCIVEWARMPRVPLSKLIYTGYLKFK